MKTLAKTLLVGLVSLAASVTLYAVVAGGFVAPAPSTSPLVPDQIKIVSYGPGNLPFSVTTNAQTLCTNCTFPVRRASDVGIYLSGSSLDTTISGTYWLLFDKTPGGNNYTTDQPLAVRVTSMTNNTLQVKFGQIVASNLVGTMALKLTKITNAAGTFYPSNIVFTVLDVPYTTTINAQ